MNPPVPPTAGPCPRCGRPSAHAFDATGLCVRCAGAQIVTQAIMDKPGSTPPLPTDTERGPRRIGPYTVISELGHGGMGTVFLAQHAELGRIVALKVIPSGGSATSDLEMRFLREARTIARLSHPHIVSVHDAGRDRGHAYFAMDYFEDGDLAHRLRAQAYAPREAATLMRQVAEAIAYSHAAGVLHRDLKPSNILLAQGAPRVADFGLAAELESASGLTARTAILGTPHYLAPEALSGGSAATGVASDVYSLGVILHELLTGRTPFAGASPAELPGLLAQGDAPDVQQLAPHVPRDLATICAKCLEFEPARRYASAAALAEDLRRYLAGEPIHARPLSTPSRLVRWARRRPALAATWLLSFSLAAAACTAAVLINRERMRANREAASSAALAEFLRKDFLEQAAAGRAPDVNLRTVMEAAVANLDRRVGHAPLVEAELCISFAHTYVSLGEHNRAEPLLRKALALRRAQLGPADLETLRAAVLFAGCLDELGRSDEAAQYVRTATSTLQRLRGPADPDTIDALETEARVEHHLGRLAQAETVARRAVELARRHLGPDHSITSNTLATLAVVLEAQGNIPEAVALCRETVAISERMLGPKDFHTLSMRLDLAAVEITRGDPALSLAMLRELHASLVELVGPDHPESLRALGHIGTAFSRVGRPADAEATFAELVAARRRLCGPEHPLTLAALKLHAIARGRNRHLDDAIAQMRALVEAASRVLGPDHLSTLDYRRNLAAMLMSARQYDEALTVAETAHRNSLRVFGAEDRSTLNDEETFANALDWKGRFTESIPHWRHLSDSYARTQPANWRTYFARGQLGKALARSDHVEEGEPLLRECFAALSGRASELPAARKNLPASYADLLASICAASGRAAEAAEWHAKAMPSP